MEEELVLIDEPIFFGIFHHFLQKCPHHVNFNEMKQ